MEHDPSGDESVLDLFTWARVRLIALILLLLTIAVVIYRRRFRAQRPRPLAPIPLPSDGIITPTMGRAAFRPQTYVRHRQHYVDHQITAMQGGTPPTAAQSAGGMDTFQDEVLVRGAEFHLRHVTPDSLLRRVVIGVLRVPTAMGIQAVRQLLQVLGGNAIIGVWDGAATDLTAYHGAGGGGTWYHALGRDRVAELRRLLTDDLNSNLFVSEAQGNLHVGTHVDITDEAMVLVGAQRMRLIADRVIQLLDDIGWRPRMELVANELLLGYDGAAGEFWRYGYRANRTHDVHVDPLALLNPQQRAIVRGHSSMRNRFLHALRHEWFALLLIGACLILAAYFLRAAWPDRE